jgi:endonuclease/exonuclease/phosphatase (EEP) superfamily protein YafD
MTFNVLGRHDQTQAIIDVIRQADPDIVFLQELNPGLAAVLDGSLKAHYPYQVLAPRAGVTGMGVISRYPLEPTGLQLPLEWVGDPQLLTLTWNMEKIALVNFHLFPSGLGTPAGVAYVYRARERQARVLAAYAAHAGAYGPVVMAGDANVTGLSTAYQILTSDLFDAWQEVGIGLGHTFPGSDIPGSSRPTLAGYPVPQWLARIDFVLHSSHFMSRAAFLGAVDGFSDHRAVIAELTLR